MADSPSSLHWAALSQGRQVACPHPAEVPLLYKQIGPYFRHGVVVNPGDTVFDVGANIGLFSLVASDWGARPLRGFAFEPAPRLFDALRANLTAHATGMVPTNCALGSEAGLLELHYYPRATALSTAFPDDLGSNDTRAGVADQFHLLPKHWRWLARLPRSVRRALARVGMALFLRPERVRCECRTLSSIIDEHQVQQIDLLKIDAERAEWDVLHGISPAHWPRIRQVVMEVHDLDGRLEAVRVLLRGHGLSDLVIEQSPSLRAFGVYQLWARRTQYFNAQTAVGREGPDAQ